MRATAMGVCSTTRGRDEPSAESTATAHVGTLVLSIAIVTGCSASLEIDSRDTTERVTSVRVPREGYAVGQLRRVGAAFVGGTPDFVDAYIWPEDVATLRAQQIDVEIRSMDYRSLRPRSKGDYHDSLTSIEALEDLAANHPALVRMVDVGTSQEGRPIVGVVISSDVWTRATKPALRILGAHHGNEWSSMEVALELARFLATSYDVDSEVRALLSAHEIWVVPVVNPDGIERFQRENARGVDLNRNYSYEWRDWTGGGPRPFSESETNAVRALSMRRSFSQSLSFHSGAAYCASAWGCHDSLPFDVEIHRHMCELYASHTDMPDFLVWVEDANSPPSDDYTFGDTNDWSYGVRGGIDYTIEVTVRPAPAAENIPEFLDWHIAPSVALLQETRAFGVMGVVTDQRTQVPLEAKVTLLPDGQPVYSDPDSGLFHRLTFPGEHSLLVESPGYEAQTVVVSASAGATTRVDISMVPTAPAGVALWRAFPSVISVDGGPVQISLHGEGLLGWTQTVRLSRFDAEDVVLSVEEQGDALVFSVDPSNLGEPYTREGFYCVSVLGNGREVSLPRGLVVTSKATGARLVDVAVENGIDANGLHRMTVNGDEMPRGADILLIGRSGSIVVPRRIEEESEDRHLVLLDPDTLVDGVWDVVMYGHARYFGLDDVLETNGGVFLDGGSDGEDANQSDPVQNVPSQGGQSEESSGDAVSMTGSFGCAANASAGSNGWVCLALIAWLARPSSKRRLL